MMSKLGDCDMKYHAAFVGFEQAFARQMAANIGAQRIIESTTQSINEMCRAHLEVSAAHGLDTDGKFGDEAVDRRQGQVTNKLPVIV
jgi:hypothetical protein